MPNRDKVPTAPGVTEPEMAAENAGQAIVPHLHILHVHVVNPIAKATQEEHGVDPLPHQVGRIEVEAERRAVVKRLEQAHGAVVVERDLSGMHLECELDSFLVEDVEDR